MAGQSPTHFAYHVREYRAGKEMRTAWTLIGPLWPHKDGKGFNLDLHLLPPDGKVVIRVAEDKKEPAPTDENAFVDADGVVS